MKKRLQGEREEGKRGMGQMDLKRKNIYIWGRSTSGLADRLVQAKYMVCWVS